MNIYYFGRLGYSRSERKRGMMKDMKKLLFVSSGLGYLKEFVGRDPSELRMVFVPTAGNPDIDGNVWWIDKDREELAAQGFHYSELDIVGKKNFELEHALDSADVVYVAGGYTYYLLEQIRATGFDAVLERFVARGGLYVGASAGALVAGVDIAPVERLDDPEYGPTLVSTKGLGFAPIVPMPHYDMSERTADIDDIVQEYRGVYEVVPMKDDEAIIVDGTTWRKVASKRSELELEWFHKNMH